MAVKKLNKVVAGVNFPYIFRRHFPNIFFASIHLMEDANGKNSIQYVSEFPYNIDDYILNNKTSSGQNNFYFNILRMSKNRYFKDFFPDKKYDLVKTSWDCPNGLKSKLNNNEKVDILKYFINKYNDKYIINLKNILCCDENEIKNESTEKLPENFYSYIIDTSKGEYWGTLNFERNDKGEYNQKIIWNFRDNIRHLKKSLYKQFIFYAHKNYTFFYIASLLIKWEYENKWDTLRNQVKTNFNENKNGIQKKINGDLFWLIEYGKYKKFYSKLSETKEICKNKYTENETGRKIKKTNDVIQNNINAYKASLQELNNAMFPNLINNICVLLGIEDKHIIADITISDLLFICFFIFERENYKKNLEMDKLELGELIIKTIYTYNFKTLKWKNLYYKVNIYDLFREYCKKNKYGEIQYSNGHFHPRDETVYWEILRDKLEEIPFYIENAEFLPLNTEDIISGLNTEKSNWYYYAIRRYFKGDDYHILFDPNARENFRGFVQYIRYSQDYEKLLDDKVCYKKDCEGIDNYYQQLNDKKMIIVDIVKLAKYIFNTMYKRETVKKIIDNGNMKKTFDKLHIMYIDYSEKKQQNDIDKEERKKYRTRKSEDETNPDDVEDNETTYEYEEAVDDKRFDSNISVFNDTEDQKKKLGELEDIVRKHVKVEFSKYFKNEGNTGLFLKEMLSLSGLQLYYYLLPFDNIIKNIKQDGKEFEKTDYQKIIRTVIFRKYWGYIFPDNLETINKAKQDVRKEQEIQFIYLYKNILRILEVIKKDLLEELSASMKIDDLRNPQLENAYKYFKRYIAFVVEEGRDNL